MIFDFRSYNRTIDPRRWRWQGAQIMSLGHRPSLKSIGQSGLMIDQSSARSDCTPTQTPQRKITTFDQS